MVQQVVAQGGEVIADYGGFQLVRVNAAVAHRLPPNSHYEEATHQNILALRAGPLDTSSAGAKALRKAVGSFGGKRLHLVHFAGPIKTEWFTALEQSGVQVVHYMPHNGYLVYGSAQALGRLQVWARTAAHVQWEGSYLDDYKIHPRARVLDAKGNLRKVQTDTFAIQLVADSVANPSTLQLIDRLKLSPIQKQSRVGSYLNVIVRLPPERLQDIAAQPEVVSIHPFFEPKKLDERQDQIVAGNLAGVGPSGPGYLAWLTGKGFTQEQFTNSGFAVDVTDSGVDNGTTTPNHFGLYEAGNSSLGSRVIYNRLEGTPHSPSTLQGCDGHGNLNSHIIGGYNDQSAGFPHTDSLGYHYGLGICPFVKVGSSVIFDPDKYTYPSYSTLQSDAYNNGARISSNSWGADTGGEYDSEAQEYDMLVRDCQSGVAGNQQMVIVFAAGNAGPDSQSLDSPGSAKNVITVGAAENVHPHSSSNGGNSALGNDGCFVPDTGADSANDIIDFSSRGPCVDGRKKPEIVAPGTHVTGGVAQNGPPPSPSGTGSANTCFKATGVCALPGGGAVGSPNDYFPLGQQFFTTSSGTSHSTPATAGACALLRQYFLNNALNAPSPAMTKVFLVNSARYMTGESANDTLWSIHQGMGEVNLGFAFDGTARLIRDQLPADKFTATGQSRTFTGIVTDASKPFRVTLGWTDAPGITSGNAYNNDLDLVVTVGGNTYKGNVFSGQYSVTGGAADPRNNLESVSLPAGLSGNFVVTVTAANINSDGVPNEAPSLDQDFALVIYNGAETLAPVISTESASIVSETCTNAAIDPGETVTVNFALKNVGLADTVNLVATLAETGGVTSASSPQVYGTLTAGGPSVSRSFSFTVTNLCGSSINCALQLQDSTNLGVVTFTIPLGAVTGVHTQNFDGITAPSLPAGWTTSTSGAQSAWITSTTQRDTLPNSAFSANASSSGVNELRSPLIGINAGAAQLSFRNSYNMESSSASVGTGYDGGVLEIKIGTGAFADILDAGGTFVAGGYTHTIYSGAGNPLANRQAWSGSSGGFINTIVNLPSAASGQSVQFRWRCGTDTGTAMTGWFVDSLAINGRACCGTNFVVPPLIDAVSSVLLTEGCAPTNAAPDPGEVVNYNFGLRNIGLSNATNVMATLLATNGVSSPSAPKNYGALNAGGATVTNSFSFTVSGTCGDNIAPTFQLQDGAQSLGLVSFVLPLGRFSTNFSERFDSVSAPALPASWTSSGGGSQAAWSTTSGSADTAPNSIFSGDASSLGINQLVTPAIIVPATALQLSFRHSYDLEASSATSAYDGGVLEIKIGAGSFTDIITAGGTFLEGPYTHTISSSYSNALAGSRCWSGSSSGFTTSTVLLPSSASGQTIQFRWRCSTDTSVGAPGWYIDSILLLGRVCCGEITAPVANFSATPTNGGKPLTVTFTDTSSGTISNRFWTFGDGGNTNTTSSSVAYTYNNGGTNSVSLAVSGPLGTNILTRTNYVVITNSLPQIVSNSLAVLAETCTNGAIDPGETVTMNFGLKNIGAASTSNLVATLLTSGGITSPSSPQSYGALGTNTSATKAFTFIPAGTCGTTNTATLQLQDGSLNLGTVSFKFLLGQSGGVAFSQNFDGVTPPALPAGWTTSASSSGIAWASTSLQSDTGANSAFSPSIDGIGLAELVSPVITLPNGASQLSFNHRYDMEGGFDGGVLDLKIGGGAFSNITNAGGIFVTNGYNAIINSGSGNPLAGQYAWSGASSGFVTTIVSLPPAAWGQNVQFRWRIGSDESFANMGWFVDTIAIVGFQCCANPPSIITQPQSQIVALGTNVTFTVSAVGTAPLMYQWHFYGTNLSGATAYSLTRSNVQPPDLGPYQVVVSNSLGSVTSSVATLGLANRPTLLWPHLSNGNFGFIISGNAGDNYMVEGSTNLSDWAALMSLSNASGQVPFTESNVWVYPGRAYRARLLP